MVRIIAGTLIRVGTGEYKPEQIPEILAARIVKWRDRLLRHNGLTMIGIEYEDLEEKELTRVDVCTIIFKSDIVKKCNSIAPEGHFTI